MICKCGAYVSGDYCKTCERVLYDKPLPKTKISKRSDKGKVDDLVYKAKRLKYLKLHPRCAVYPELKATEIHHKAGRVGKNFLDESTWLAVSRKAHLEIESKPEWAKENGYSQSRLKTT